MPHICLCKLTIIVSDNGLSPGRRQAIIWTNAGILSIGPLGTNFIEILMKIHTLSFKKMHVKMSSGKCRPSCLGLNVLNVLETSLKTRSALGVNADHSHIVMRRNGPPQNLFLSIILLSLSSFFIYPFLRSPMQSETKGRSYFTSY